MPRSTRLRAVAALGAALLGAGLSVLPAGARPTPGTTNPVGAGITVTAATTVLDASVRWLPVRAGAASLSWSAADVNGVGVGSGTIRLHHGTGRVPVPRVAPGWYSLHLATARSSAVTTFAVVAGAHAPVRVRHNQFGVQIHPQTASTAETAAVAAMGQGGVRIDLRWEQVERTRGVYTFDADEDARIRELEAAGVRPLLIMGYFNPLYDDNRTPSSPAGLAAYAAYAAASARHYGTRVDYEIYNEYNLGYSNGACGQSADCYFALLEPTATAIHRAVPGARVVGPTLGGVTPYWVGAGAPATAWMKRLFDLGGLRYLDVISMHNYSYPAAPEGNNEAAIRTVRALIDSYRGGAQKPLWLTETGWPTVGRTAGGVSEYDQAQYLVRDAALSLHAGLDHYLVYDMLDDYADPTNGEARFGLVHNPAEAAGTIAPKPGFVAYAVLTRQLAGYRADGSDPVGDGAYSLRFTGPRGDTRRVLWSPTGRTVAVRTARPVVVTAAQGGTTTLYPVHGVVPLNLGPDAIHLAGSGIRSVTAVGGAAYTATVGTPILQDRPATVRVALDPAAGAARGRLVVTTSYGARARVGADGSATVALPAFPQPGEVRVPITVSRGGRVLGRLVVTGTVEADPSATLVPVSGSRASASATLQVGYRGAGPGVTLDDVDWSVGTASGTVQPAAPLDAGHRVSVALPASGLPLWTPQRYSVTYTFSDGARRTVTGTTAFAPMYTDGRGTPPAADLDTAGHWVDLGGGRSGAADVSGSLWLSYSATGVTVHADVVDDVQSVAAEAPILWQGDSIQFGFTAGLPGAGGTQTEFGAALLASGPTVFRFTGAGGVESDASAVITRSEATHTTSYAVTLPWSAVGVPATSPYLSFSFLANDDDGSGRAGFLEWGSGIGVLKDVTQYLPVQRS